VRRILLFDREFWRFCGRLAWRAPGILWEASKGWVTFAGVAFLYLGFNRQLADQGLSVFGSVSPLWALLPVGLLFVYGLMKANYEAFMHIEGERDGWKGKHEKLFAEPESANSLPFRSPRRLLPPDEASKPYLADYSFRFVDLIGPEHAMNQTTIRDRTFYKCTIHGPAVMMPMKNSQFRGVTKFFNEPQILHPESLFYTIPGSRPLWFAGVAGTEGCVFHDCTFVDVGFAGHPEAIEEIRKHVNGGGDAHIL
jgi:hypothetical protein